jgi:hypothetical protein
MDGSLCGKHDQLLIFHREGLAHHFLLPLQAHLDEVGSQMAWDQSEVMLSGASNKKIQIWNNNG